jgi:ABC-type cobalamin/Fe3+-siderophores transport system ATPase subunit
MESVDLNLAARQLTLRSGTRTLIEALDLTLEPGEVLGILGANGAGKSTLLAVLAGLAAPAQGRVTLDGHALDTLPPLARARHIGLLPQGDEGGFFGSVTDFVALGRYPFGDAPGDPASQLAAWELGDLARRPLDTLSGGERQRARLAQLGVQTPDYYLLDEPLTHLDPARSQLGGQPLRPPAVPVRGRALAGGVARNPAYPGLAGGALRPRHGGIMGQG